MPDGGVPTGPLPVKPPVHVPFVVAVTCTDVTFAVPDAADDEADSLATTHSPTFTAASVPVTSRVNVVVPVQLTAVCPDDWLCTCMVLPETAAIRPDAAGPNAPPPDG